VKRRCDAWADVTSYIRVLGFGRPAYRLKEEGEVEWLSYSAD
jgi:hypothetical protein